MDRLRRTSTPRPGTWSEGEVRPALTRGTGGARRAGSEIPEARRIPGASCEPTISSRAGQPRRAAGRSRTLDERPPERGTVVPGLPAAPARSVDRCRAPQMAGGATAFTSSLNVQLAEALFDRAGRDVESVGLGWVEPRTGRDTGSDRPRDGDGDLRSCVRLLGLGRHYAGAEYAKESATMRGAVKRYLERVAGHREHRPRPAHQWVTRVLASVRSHPVAAADPVADRPARPGRGRGRMWRCPYVRLPASASLR